MTEEPETAAALRWVEPTTSVPRLRARVAPGGRLLVEASDTPLLLARVERDWAAASLALVAPDGPVAVLPPWTAAECRRVGDDTQRWFHEIRDRLRVSRRSPVHAGSWHLAAHPHPWSTPAGFAAGAVQWLDDELVRPVLTSTGTATAEIDYFRHGPGAAAALVPLRVLSAPDAPRVSAQRRLLREGVRAPVVLLRVSGLAGHLVLDGHDRLVAAVAEGVVPSFACLARTDPDEDERRESLVVAEYEQTMSLLDDLDRAPGRLPRPDEHRAQAARRLATQLAAEGAAPTLAWPMGIEDWEVVARRVAPGWPGEASG